VAQKNKKFFSRSEDIRQLIEAGLKTIEKKLRLHVKKLTLLMIVLVFLAGCGSGNNTDDINSSQNRIADKILLKIEIEDIDLQLSRLTRINSQISASSSESKNLISSHQVKINELKSEKEILFDKLNLLRETEQEFQSKK
jgi:hypothetical protein